MTLFPTVVIKNGPSAKQLKKAAEALVEVSNTKEEYAKSATQNGKDPVMMPNVEIDYCDMLSMFTYFSFTAKGCGIFNCYIKSQAEVVEPNEDGYNVRLKYRTGILTRKLRTITGAICILEPHTDYVFKIFYNPAVKIGHAVITRP